MKLSKFTEHFIQSGGEPWDEYTDKFIIRVVKDEEGKIISTTFEYKLDGYPEQEIQSGSYLFRLYAKLLTGSNIIPVALDEDWPIVDLDIRISKKDKEYLLLVLSEADKSGFFDQYKGNN